MGVLQGLDHRVSIEGLERGDSDGFIAGGRISGRRKDADMSPYAPVKQGKSML